MSIFIFVLLLLPDTPLYLIESTTEDDLFENQNFNFEKSKKKYLIFKLIKYKLRIL